MLEPDPVRTVAPPSALIVRGPGAPREPSIAERLAGKERLAALDRSGLLSASFEDRYDRFVRLASRLLGVPIALISLVEPHRQYFKSYVGLEEPWASRRETLLSHSFCKHVVVDDAPLVVGDAREDARVRDNGAVADLGVVAYLGAPIHGADGQVLGALCAIDGEPREWTPDDVQALTELADTLAVEVELGETARRLVAEEAARTAEADALRAARDELVRQGGLLQTTLSGAPLVLYAFDADGTITVSRGAGLGALGLAEGEVVGASIFDFSEPGTEPDLQTRRVMAGHPAEWMHEFGGEVFETRAVPSPDGGGVAVAHVVTDRVRAEEEATTQRRRLQRLLSATASQGTFAERSDAVLREMAGLLGLTTGLLARIESGTYTCLAAYTAHGDTLAPGESLPLGITYCDLTIERGDLVAIDRMSTSPFREHPCYAAIGLEAYIGVPVLVDGAPVGALSFSSGQPAERPFSEADHDLVRLAGQWAGALLEREAREADVAREAHRLRVLADAFAADAASGFDSMADMLERLRALLGLEIAIVSEIDPASDRYRVHACAAPEGGELAVGDTFSFNCTYCHITHDADDVWDVTRMRESDKAGHPCYEAFGLEAYIGVPVLVDGERFGTLNFSSPTPRAEPFTDRDRDLVRLAARWVGSRIESERHLAHRVDAERRAHEQDAQYRLLAENATDLVALHGPDGTFEWVSPSVEALLGRPPEALVGTALGAIVHPDDARALRRVLRAPGGATDRAEVRLLHADGHAMWVEMLVRPVTSDDGGPVRLLSSSRDVTRRRAAQDELYHQAHHDVLTGLPNRALFTARLDVAVSAPDPSFAVLFIDLDRFKVINDTLGHSVGDKLLQAVAGRLAGVVRGDDTVARLGGDEFAVLLESIPSPDFPTVVAERMLAALAPDIEVGEHALAARASIGVVLGRTDHADSDAVLTEADLAMYDAKGRGRGTAATFSPQTFGPASQRMRLEADLPRAVERGELRVAYQPIVRLDDGALHGFEALVRWEHPGLGLLMPGAFIGAAEVSGAIAGIDHWVLREACRQRAAWTAAHPDLPPVVLSVNCTGQDLLDPTYTAAVEAALAEQPGQHDWLVLEITEGLLVEDEAAVAARLRHLQALGVRFALDDFGTGYSSLSTLHALPVDTVKVDRSFVGDMGAHDRSRKLVETVVGLGRLLGRSVVAEGIERAEDAGTLRDLGCPFGQGYLFSKPLAVEGAGRLLAGPLPWARPDA